MTEKQENIIRDLVRNYLFKNPKLVEKAKLTDEGINHIINTGTDLLSKKWGLIPYCGSFVQSILDNNLTDTFAKADETNEQFIKFYVVMNYNIGKPMELNKEEV